VANRQAPRISRTLDRVEVVDDLNFRLHFTQPDVAFLQLLGFPVVSQRYFERVGEDEAVRRPMGTGAYKLTNHVTGEYVDLEANPDYWGGAPDLKKVRLRFVAEDNTRVAMLKAGEASIVMSVPYPLVDEVDSTRGLKTIKQDSGGLMNFIAFQFVNPQTPWAKREVRQAMAHALDREAIINSVLEGVPVNYPGLAPTDIGYDPELKHYEYNLDQARALLAQAGYPNGFEFTFNYMGNLAIGVKEAVDAATSFWSRVGIRAQPQAWEPVKFQEFNQMASGKPDQDYVALVTASLAGKPEVTVGLFNHFSKGTPFARYFNDDVDRLIVQARGTVDPNARGELVKQAMKIIHQDVAFIPMWSVVNVYGMKDGIELTPRPSDFPTLFLKDVKVRG